MEFRLKFSSGRIIGLAISEERGIQKHPVESIKLLKGVGVAGDAHSGSYREVSVLSKTERDSIALRDLKPGEAAENILIDGIKNLSEVEPGYKIKLGNSAILEVLQVGKEFHNSQIHEFTGRPVLPKVGVFCRVVSGGIVHLGDTVKIII